MNQLVRALVVRRGEHLRGGSECLLDTRPNFLQLAHDVVVGRWLGVDVTHFGEILGITNTDLAITATVLVVVMLALFLMWKQLIFTTFDQDVAGAYGVPVRAVEGVFSLILAASVIASLQVLGVTLLAAALVIPPVGARLLTDSFTRMFFIAVALGTLTGFFGAYMSWFVDSSSGATIVLLQAAVFVLALSYAGARSRWLRRGARETERIAGLEKTVY